MKLAAKQLPVIASVLSTQAKVDEARLRHQQTDRMQRVIDLIRAEEQRALQTPVLLPN